MNVVDAATDGIRPVSGNDTSIGGQYYLLESALDNTTRVKGRYSAPLFVEMFWNGDVGVMADDFRHGDEVVVGADLSPWVPVYLSLWYQLGCRWATALLYFGAFLLAAQYLIQHADIIKRQLWYSTRSGYSFLRDNVQRLRLIHLALLLAFAKAGVWIGVALLGGHESVPILPLETQMATSSGVAGVDNAIIVIIVHHWHQIVTKSEAGSRLRHYTGPVTVALSVVLIGADLAVAYLLATYQSARLPVPAITITVGVDLAVLLLVLYAVVDLVRFRLHLKASPSDCHGTFARHLNVQGQVLAAIILVQVLAAAWFGEVQHDPWLQAVSNVLHCTLQPVRLIVSIWILQPRHLWPLKKPIPTVPVSTSKPLAEADQGVGALHVGLSSSTRTAARDDVDDS